MSYTPGTSLGRVREIIGDTVEAEEMFTDEYLNDLLTQYNTPAHCAIAALRRVILEPKLMREKFKGYGQMNINNLGNFIRIIEELIKHLYESSSSIVDAPDSESAFPGADQTDIGRSTDEDGWYERSTLDSYLLDMETRI